MADPRFTEALRRKLRKRKRLPRPPKILHPDSQTRTYRRLLEKMVAAMGKAVNEKVKAVLPALIAQRNNTLPDTLKQDAWPEDLQGAFRNAKDEFTREYTADEIRSLASRAGLSVAEFNALQLSKNFQRVVGVDVFASEAWLTPQLQAFAAQNVALIQGVADKYFLELEAGILEQLANGYRFEEIGKFIEDRLGVTESRAAFIARDQVSTLNGQLTGLRQTNAGVTKYIWRTSQDERVRESHREKEGKEFSWSDPPADTGHPGEDFNCRCYSEPVFESVVEGEAEFKTGAGED